MDLPWLKFYEPTVPPTIQYPTASLPNFLSQSASKYPNNPAIFYYGTKLSYAALEDQVNRFANALVSLGVLPGARVSIMLPNLPQCVIAYYGALKMGGTVGS